MLSALWSFDKKRFEMLDKVGPQCHAELPSGLYGIDCTAAPDGSLLAISSNVLRRGTTWKAVGLYGGIFHYYELRLDSPIARHWKVMVRCQS
jgi:hypothetical protein